MDPSKLKKNSSGSKMEQALPGLPNQGPPQDVSRNGMMAEPCLQVSVLIHAYRTALREAPWASPVWWNHPCWPYLSQGHSETHITCGSEPPRACEGQGCAHGKGNYNIWGPAGTLAGCLLYMSSFTLGELKGKKTGRLMALLCTYYVPGILRGHACRVLFDCQVLCLAQSLESPCFLFCFWFSSLLAVRHVES